MIAPNNVIVADIETIPLSESILLDNEKVNPLFQRIVCLSYAELDANLDVKKLRTLGLPGMSEKKVVKEFSKVLTDHSLLVTWGGRGFDVPVLGYRAMVHGIQIPEIFDVEFSKRYSTLGHFDLQDDMGFLGAVGRLRLDHAAVVLGLPGKMDVKASNVQELVARNRFNEVRRYCVTDVVQTLVLFLRWAHLRGNATVEEVNNSLDSLFSPDIYEDEADSELSGVELVKSSCNWEALKLS